MSNASQSYFEPETIEDSPETVRKSGDIFDPKTGESSAGQRRRVELDRVWFSHSGKPED